MAWTRQSKQVDAEIQDFPAARLGGGSSILSSESGGERINHSRGLRRILDYLRGNEIDLTGIRLVTVQGATKPDPLGLNVHVVAPDQELRGFSSTGVTSAFS